MKRLIKSMMVLGVGVFSVIYLVNPGAGVVEFLPDNLPLVGNLDEAAITLVLLHCLAYFGLDLRRAANARKVRPGLPLKETQDC